jgi:hypothetical protein
MYCQEERELNCDSCYEITKEYCSEITINSGLIPLGYETVYLQIIDHFLIRRAQEVIIDEEGNFTIDDSLLPDNLLNPYAGKFELYLSSDEEGLIKIPMTFSGANYNCIILTIIKTIENDCC